MVVGATVVDVVEVDVVVGATVVDVVEVDVVEVDVDVVDVVEVDVVDVLDVVVLDGVNVAAALTWSGTFLPLARMIICRLTFWSMKMRPDGSNPWALTVNVDAPASGRNRQTLPPFATEVTAAWVVQSRTSLPVLAATAAVEAPTSCTV